VIDGIDGRAHHLGLPDLEAAGDLARGSIVEFRRYQDATGRNRVAIAVRSDFPIEDQVAAHGATWLDRQLLKRESALSDSGFGAELRDTMDRRVDHLSRKAWHAGKASGSRSRATSSRHWSAAS
jgi:Protein of unknown function (DUF3363)